MLERLQQLIDRAQRHSTKSWQQRGLSQVLIKGVKAGDLSGWTASKVVLLCRAAGMDHAAFCAGEPIERTMRAQFLRKGGDFHPDDQGKLETALELASSLASLRRALSLGPSLAVQFKPRPLERVPFQDGYELAREVRRALGNESGCLPSLFRLLPEVFEVFVYRTALQSKRVEAAVAIHQDLRAVVMPRGGLRSLLARRTLAHELCHALFDAEGQAVVIAEYGDEQEPLEQRARAFASEFLVPLAGLKRVLGDPGVVAGSEVQRVRTVSAEFRAPNQLVVQHLYNHQYLSREQRDQMLASPAHSKIKGDSYVDVRRMLIEQALLEKLITAGRRRELIELAA